MCGMVLYSHRPLIPFHFSSSVNVFFLFLSIVFICFVYVLNSPLFSVDHLFLLLIFYFLFANNAWCPMFRFPFFFYLFNFPIFSFLSFFFGSFDLVMCICWMLSCQCLLSHLFCLHLYIQNAKGQCIQITNAKEMRNIFEWVSFLSSNKLLVTGIAQTVKSIEVHNRKTQMERRRKIMVDNFV